MTASPKSVPVRRYAAFSLLLALGASCTDRNLPLEPTPTKPASGLLAAAQSPRVAGQFPLRPPHRQLLPQKKQQQATHTPHPPAPSPVARPHRAGAGPRLDPATGP